MLATTYETDNLKNSNNYHVLAPARFSPNLIKDQEKTLGATSAKNTQNHFKAADKNMIVMLRPLQERSIKHLKAADENMIVMLQPLQER